MLTCTTLTITSANEDTKDISHPGSFVSIGPTHNPKTENNPTISGPVTQIKSKTMSRFTVDLFVFILATE